MAGPGGREVGRVSIRVLPDTSSFGRSLERYLQRIERTTRVELPVELQSGDVAAAEATLDELARDRTINLNVDVDESLLDRLQKTFKKAPTPDVGGGGLASSLQGILAVTVGLGAILPLLGTLVLGIPGLVAAIAAPIGVILAGLDGINAASKVLDSAWPKMFKGISKVFETELTPVFKQLLRIFPTLSAGMQTLAESLSGLFANIVGGLTSDKGLNLIADIFGQLSKALDILGPSLKPLTEAFLILIDEGMKQFVSIAPSLAGLTETFAKFVVWAQETGILQQAFEFLGDVILGLIGLFFGLVAAGTVIAAMWVRVGNAVGALPDLFSRVADGIAGFFQSLPDRIGGFLQRLPGMLQAIAVSAMALMLAGFSSGAGELFGFLAGIPSEILGLFLSIPEQMFQIGASIIGGLIDGIGSRFGDVQDLLGNLTGLIPDWKGPISVDRMLLFGSGAAIIKSLGAGMESEFAGVQAMLGGFTADLTAVPATAFAPGGFHDRSQSASLHGARLHLVLEDGRALGAFVEEVADSRVGAAAGIGGMTERAFGS